MSRAKKSKVDDVVKLRKILDNSSDPNIKALISTDEKALESVRRRLAGDTRKRESHYDRFFRTFDSLEPRVTIHPKNVISSRVISPLPKYKLLTTLPEFKSVSSSTYTKSIPSQELLCNTQDLYEIEKVDVILPQPADISSLPEWQPVEEIQQGELPRDQAKSEVDHIPEFEREDTSITTEKVEKTGDWEPIPQKGEPTETPVQFTAVESPEPQPQKEGPTETLVQFTAVESLEPQHQRLLKKQEREAKKIQKAKEKEAKRLKKIELKKLKRETRDKEREAKRIITEKRDIQQIPAENEFIQIKQKRKAKEPQKKSVDSTEWESYFVEKKLKKPSLKSICTYEEYTLYKKEIGKYKGKKTIIHFFSKENPDIGHPVQLPDGYKIAVNNRTGIPYLKKKK